jgi:hypothetical protein
MHLSVELQERSRSTVTNHRRSMAGCGKATNPLLFLEIGESQIHWGIRNIKANIEEKEYIFD